MLWSFIINYSYLYLMYFSMCFYELINPVFHNVTPVAHGLKLVITRKINLKNFEIFFYKQIIRLCIERFISYLQFFFEKF